MNTDTQKPSEHAIRAAEAHWRPIFNAFQERVGESIANDKAVIDLAKEIDQHAIAPAVAEATAKLEQELSTAHAVGSSYAKELAEARREVAERDKRIAELGQALRNMLNAHMDVYPDERWACMERAAWQATTILAKKGQP